MNTTRDTTNARRLLKVLEILLTKKSANSKKLSASHSKRVKRSSSLDLTL